MTVSLACSNTDVSMVISISIIRARSKTSADFLPRRHGFSSRRVHVGFVVDKAVARRVFICTRVLSWGMDKGSLRGRCFTETQNQELVAFRAAGTYSYHWAWIIVSPLMCSTVRIITNNPPSHESISVNFVLFYFHRFS